MPRIPNLSRFFFLQVRPGLGEASRGEKLISIDVDPLLPRGYDDYQLEKDNSAPLIGIQIKSWMDTCTEHHSECPKPKSVRGEFPTRLFEVGDTVRVSYDFLNLNVLPSLTVFSPSRLF